jgi:hypothetical protein
MRKSQKAAKTIKEEVITKSKFLARTTREKELQFSTEDVI